MDYSKGIIPCTVHLSLKEKASCSEVRHEMGPVEHNSWLEFGDTSGRLAVAGGTSPQHRERLRPRNDGADPHGYQQYPVR